MQREAKIPPNFSTIKYNWGIWWGSGNISYIGTEGIQQLKEEDSTSWHFSEMSHSFILSTSSASNYVCSQQRALLSTSTLMCVPCNYLLYIYMNTNKTWDSVWAQTPFIEIEVTFRNPDLQLPHSHVLHWDHIHTYSAQTCSQTHPELNQIATLQNSSLQVSYFFNLRLS